MMKSKYEFGTFRSSATWRKLVISQQILSQIGNGSDVPANSLLQLKILVFVFSIVSVVILDMTQPSSIRPSQYFEPWPIE